MRNILRFIQSIPWSTQLIGWGTLGIWLIKAIWLDEKPAPIQALYDLSHVVEGIFAAIISGYVFYVLFALWPDYEARRVMSPFIFGKVRGIVGDCLGIIEQISIASGSQIDFWTIDDPIALAAFTAISFNSTPNTSLMVNGVVRPSTWFEFFYYREKRTKDAISELFAQGRFMDASANAILTEIFGSSFYMQTSGVSNMPINNPNLGAWADGFMRYIESCRKLASWHDRNCAPGTAQFHH